MMSSCNEDVKSDDDWKNSTLCHQLIGTSWQRCSSVIYSKDGSIAYEDNDVSPYVHTFTDKEINNENLAEHKHRYVLEAYNINTKETTSGDWYLISDKTLHAWCAPSFYGEVISISSDYLKIRTDYDDSPIAGDLGYKIEIFKSTNSGGNSDNGNNNNFNDNDNPGSGNNTEDETYVSTESRVELSPLNVTLYGFLKGMAKPIEVGFQLSLSPEMKATDCRTTKLETAGGRFDATFKGILDLEKYYYRAYALIDDKYYYGDIQSFETGPLTYTVNGKEFKVIKVEGGPYGDFSIMQTEIAVNDRVIIGDIDMGMTFDDCDKVDGKVSAYEFKKYMANLIKKTGLAFRCPTSYEWMFAASGGQYSKNYKYSGSDDIDEVAWYAGNCSGPQNYGLKKANELGIYDMCGNYSEIITDLPLKLLETQTFGMNADYYKWYDGQKAYGGRWNQIASKCTVISSENKSELNIIDGGIFAFRFIYSHNINFYYDE